MKSMTGFGKSELSEDGRKIRVEMKSVNHRFLDISIRIPRFLLSMEDDIRKYLKGTLSRGRVDVFVNYFSERTDARRVLVDYSMIRGYWQAAQEIEKSEGIPNNLQAAELLRLPDAVSFEENDEDTDAVRALLFKAVAAAEQELTAARESEGKELLGDILMRLQTVLTAAEQIESRESDVLEGYRERLGLRVSELLGDSPVDDARLAQEVALYADKANITEEVVRVRSHVEQFTKAARSGQPQGRNLDFIVQELNREFNTIGSKANDAGITKMVIAGKVEIEKIREQIQNLE